MGDDEGSGSDDATEEAPSREWVSVERVNANQPFDKPPPDWVRADGF